jgi:hypothetical protein
MTRPPHLDEWQLFTRRYGRSRRVDDTSWSRRHRGFSDDSHRCVCPGRVPHVIDSNPPDPCIQRATQEDILCDECREWCVAIDNAGVYHQLASLW